MVPLRLKLVKNLAPKGKQCSSWVRTQTVESNTTEFQSELRHLLIPTFLSSLGLSFLACEMEMTVPASGAVVQTVR